MNTWRDYIIGTDRQTAKRFYAPDLLTAFHIARCNGFGSRTIHCFGSVER